MEATGLWLWGFQVCAFFYEKEKISPLILQRWKEDKRYTKDYINTNKGTTADVNTELTSFLLKRIFKGLLSSLKIHPHFNILSSGESAGTPKQGGCDFFTGSWKDWSAVIIWHHEPQITSHLGGEDLVSGCSFAFTPMDLREHLN